MPGATTDSAPSVPYTSEKLYNNGLSTFNDHAPPVSQDRRDFDKEERGTTVTRLEEDEARPTSLHRFRAVAEYLLLNLSLTMYNKLVLGAFHYPWLLTTVHAGFVAVAGTVMITTGTIRLTKLDLQEQFILVCFSTLFTVNIAVSNISLAMVSVPFHQTVRALCPVFTVLMYRLWYAKLYSSMTYASLIFICAGVALASFGEYDCTALGGILTFAGVLLAAAKTIATNRILTGRLKLSPMETLFRMSTLATFQSLICSYQTGELQSFQQEFLSGRISNRTLVTVFGNGLLALLLNISSFRTNKIVGALTMTVTANVKQCLTILSGIAVFHSHVSVLNGLGMMTAMAGAAWYSFLEIRASS